MISDLIQLGILIVSFITLYYYLKRENAKTLNEVIKSKVSETEEFALLEARVQLLEQKVDLHDEALRGEIENLKNLIQSLKNELINYMNIMNR